MVVAYSRHEVSISFRKEDRDDNDRRLGRAIYLGEVVNYLHSYTVPAYILDNYMYNDNARTT